ncbi:hypothetical protein [Spelaeicoccus albus]|uniref:Uncharacterized protein n=1 Tax=Spelaeicoccus albus TaxID=1280376 RepID=A0A7Z0D3P1_9MICO|nr:hypothetical protein [Spelaeicoccus albus]NYI68297.1 hypothetical protein [Spelaeicoccus albus]
MAHSKSKSLITVEIAGRKIIDIRRSKLAGWPVVGRMNDRERSIVAHDSAGLISR